VLIDPPMQQRGQHNGVAEAADGKQFRAALQHGNDNGLQCAHCLFLDEGCGFGKGGGRR